MTNIVAVALLFFFSVANAANASDLLVNAQRLEDGTFVISGTATVKASTETVWGTITDFEQIPSFIPVITSSNITNNEPLRLAQTMKASFSICGIRFSKSTKIVYEVLITEQSPTRNVIIFKRVGGGFRSLESSYSMESNGDETKIVMSITAVPGFWESTVIDAPAVGRLAEKQLRNLATEVERRENIVSQLLAKTFPTPISSSLR